MLFQVGAAVGTVSLAATVSGTTTVATAKFFATVAVDAKRKAEKVAKRMIRYYKRHG